MNEFALIEQLTRSWPRPASVVAGVGEDCAVLDLGIADQFVLFKTDAVVEGVHFTAEAAPAQIGHKALARCLSDIAAMAGTPTHALITLGLPRDHDPAVLEEIYRGIGALADRYQVALVGGETTTNPDRLLLSVSVLGTVPKDRCLLRSGAQPGDALFVTGELGGALAGKHLEFQPRLREAQWLAAHFPVHSMIDLSDGLAGDLRHVLKASGVGAELHGPSIPISRAARRRGPGQSSGRTPFVAALTDGEDFELLFSVSSRAAVSLLDQWNRQFPELRLTCVGKITRTPDLTLRDKTGCKPLVLHGYLHFS
jgi:thiamine-monophosphate kinase